MSERFDPRALPVQAFCKATATLSGAWPLAGMPRLLDSVQGVPGADDAVDWTADGSLRPVTGGDAEIWLHLQARATVTLQCQRCLQAMQQPLQVDRRFRFVRTEAQAEQLDEIAEDDVLVLAPTLNLHELLEDELILALPIVPRHEEPCPVPLPMPVDDLPDDEPEPNPFAALAALRTGRRNDPP